MAASAGLRNLYILLAMMKSVKSAEPFRDTQLWPATKHSFSQSSDVLLMRKAAAKARKRLTASSICSNFPYFSQARHTKLVLKEITGNWHVDVCVSVWGYGYRSVMYIQTTHTPSDLLTKEHIQFNCNSIVSPKCWQNSPLIKMPNPSFENFEGSHDF